ncbi:MAG: alpha/beta hydrolase [Acidobacteria bacterium]|nr:alpha/beta hydrolase [Acidobacteriota bacterium]MBI3281470.1 alpha/beta hydrolase [Acidobacteriota bacterium]
MSIEPVNAPPVRGYLHVPEAGTKTVFVLAHGAGSNCEAPLLAALAHELEARGAACLRIDLPFRQQRPTGPPRPAGAAGDRAGLWAAAEMLRARWPGRPLVIGGQSYGGRQASMLAAEAPDLAAGLLLLSYPLHPPGAPEQLRTTHFPKLRARALFVHGSRDPFGSIPELRAALKLVPEEPQLMIMEGAGHELARRPRAAAVAARIAEASIELV